MQKTVITICGCSNTGKTSTIKKFYAQLKPTYPKMEEIHSKDEEGDIQKILVLKDKDKDITIGIESQGDPNGRQFNSRQFNSRLFESLPMFVKENCDIIVCASRTKSSTRLAVNDLRNSGYKIIRFSNFVSDLGKDSDIMNSISAKFLLDVFEQVLNDKS